MAIDQNKALQTISGQVRIEFAELRSNEHARCERSFMEVIIKVNRTYWEGKPESWKELLIFHELGHCILGLGHSTDPSHIMATDVDMPHARYVTHRSDMLSEMFSSAH